MAEPALPAGRTELDEVMLAMDVVDTIRHREAFAERELDESRREAELFERLRSIYRGQGIEVPDRVLREGVEALKESRFTYEPPKPGLARWLALLWVNRGRYKRTLGALLIACFLGALVYYIAVARPRAEIGRELAGAHATIAAGSPAPAARQRADRLLAEGRQALDNRQEDAARASLRALEALRAELPRAYALKIVGQTMRSPRTALHRRDHYLIVEARAPDGGLVELPVTSEEDGTTRAASRFAVKVSPEVYMSVERDRQDDGVIQADTLGDKRAGEPDLRYVMPVLGGALLQW